MGHHLLVTDEGMAEEKDLEAGRYRSLGMIVVVGDKCRINVCTNVYFQTEYFQDGVAEHRV